MSSRKDTPGPRPCSSTNTAAQQATTTPRKAGRDTTKSNPRLPEAIEIGKAVFRPLRDSKLKYLEDDDLARFRITRTCIEFFSGKPGEGVEQLIDPIKPDVIEEWLRTTQAQGR
ncbi:hypothetical protein IMZ48_17275 [Candidatus Bathyarchaeota archaeon]|nr:hypothetical protein [Candidatus Bathyarchaeota archaeon]